REDHVDDDEGHVTSTVRQWDRRHWGAGGREFHWWCTEAPDAFVGSQPVYREMQAELTELVGAKIYDQLVALLRERDRRRGQGVPLPHPAVRRRPSGAGARAASSNGTKRSNASKRTRKSDSAAEPSPEGAPEARAQAEA
ncbi:MAG TPA: hypothetical protein VIX84_04155, partial [Acidimicrobiales bacterium]